MEGASQAMSWTTLRRILDDSDSRGGRAFAFGIQGLIACSIVLFCIETLPSLSESTLRFLAIAETVTVAVFSAEYVLRILAAENKRKFIFSFYGLVDLAAILPFYLASGVDLRSVRILRMFRLLRLLKLFRYSRALRRFQTALVSVRDELVLFVMACISMIFLASVGIYHFEHDAQPEVFVSIFDGMWWAVATLTTVGYGDAYPITAGGRFFTVAILVVGLGVVSVPVGLIASALTRTVNEERAED